MESPKHKIDTTQWVDRYADYLFNYAITRVNDSYVAEELVQETFVAGLKAMKNFKGEATERTWLISILKRKIIDQYQKANSKKGQAEVRMDYSTSSDREGDWLEEQVEDSTTMNAESRLENKELGLAIEICLEKLPVKQAEIFKQKTILEQETDTICKEHDITASNLWVIIHRARVQLMKCLEDDWFKN
ncbi:MAG: sigma-70 family RNA polymerase sigma factor [Flavobacteriaceae bacterium]